MWRIVDTQPDGTVRVTVPTPRVLKAFTTGGFGSIAKAVELPLDPAEIEVVEGPGSIPREIEKMAASGIAPDVARRWVNAILVGGETDSTAADLFRLRDCRDGINHQRVDSVQADRFHRNAWRLREGKIYVDLDVARTEFAKRLIAAKRNRIDKLADEIEVAMASGRSSDAIEAAHAALVEMNLRELGTRVAQARSPEELKALWPVAVGNQWA